MTSPGPQTSTDTDDSTPTPPPPSGAVVSGAVAALQRVLAAQHAAVYAYSVIGVHLSDPAQIGQARSLQEQHRTLRDQVSSEIAARNATPQAAAPSYSPDEPVTDAAGAQRWALSIEQGCAAGYRAQLAASASDDNPAAERTAALAGLTGAARDAQFWRQLLTPATPTAAFPGLA